MAEAKEVAEVLGYDNSGDVPRRHVRFTDGTTAWQTPAGVEVEIVNDRTGEHVEVSDVKVGGVAVGGLS